MMSKKYIFGIGGLLLVIFICVFLVKNIKYATSISRSSTNPSISFPKEVTITLDKNGFSPNNVTIKVGTAVLWKNESGKAETVNSDNYPTNQLHKELNFGVFNSGSSVVYTFTKIGTYGYHNQFNHTQTGEIIVVN